MSFASRQTSDLVRVASAGGGFVLDAAARPTEDLVRIASAGSSKGARLVFTGLAARPTEDLVRIGSAGHGCVQFAP
jgi:hypothetical protein